MSQAQWLTIFPAINKSFFKTLVITLIEIYLLSSYEKLICSVVVLFGFIQILNVSGQYSLTSNNICSPRIFFSLSFQLIKEMALIMKYIDSMHHYMDKYGGKSIFTVIAYLNCKAHSIFVLIARAHNNPSLTFTHG